MDGTLPNRSPPAATRKRRSSILKSQRAPRTPFSELEFNVATPTDTVKSRRVSFSRRTEVAEYVTNEATTTWKNVYEELNKSLESSANKHGDKAPRPSVSHLGKRIFDQQFEEVDLETLMNPVQNPQPQSEVICTREAVFTNATFIDASNSGADKRRTVVFDESSANISITQGVLSNVIESNKQNKTRFNDDEVLKTNNTIKNRVNSDSLKLKTIVSDENFGDISITETVPSNVMVLKNPNNTELNNDGLLFSDVSKDIPFQNKPNSNSSKRRTVVFDEDSNNISITQTVPSNYFEASNKLNKTGLIEDMSLTEVLSHNISFKNKPSSTSNKRNTVVFDENSADISITQAAPSNYFVATNKLNKTGILDDMSLSEVLPSNISLKIDSNSDSNKRKTIVFDKDSADVSITQAVPSNVFVASNKFNKTGILDDMSLSLTEVLPQNILLKNQSHSTSDKRNTVVFDEHSDDVSITQAAPSNYIVASNKLNKTELMDDMSQTEVLYHNMSLKNKPHFTSDKRNTICFDEHSDDISITQDAPSNNIVASNKLNKTGLLDDMSVTEVLSQNILLKNKSQSTSEKRNTVVFDEHSDDVSITQAAPSNYIVASNKLNKTGLMDDMSLTEVLSQNISLKNKSHSTSDKRNTVVFDEYSDDVSITQAVPSNYIVATNKLNKTGLVDDDMSMTDILSHNMSLKHKSYSDSNKRKTVVFDEDSADVSITQAVPSNFFLTSNKLNKTELVEDDLTLTEMIPNNTTLNNKTNNSNKRKTVVFDEDSGNVSITQAVPLNVIITSNKQNNLSFTEDLLKDTPFSNKSTADITKSLVFDGDPVAITQNELENIVKPLNQLNETDCNTDYMSFNDIIAKDVQLSNYINTDIESDATDKKSADVSLTKKKANITSDKLNNTELNISNIHVRNDITFESKTVTGKMKRNTVVFDKESADISITRSLPSNILSNEINNVLQNFSNVSTAQASNNQSTSTFDHKEMLGTDKRKTIVFDEDDGDVSITKALPLNVILALSKMNYTEENMDTTSCGQEFEPNATLNKLSVSAKRSTIVSDSNCADVSMNQAESAQKIEITRSNEEKMDISFSPKDSQETDEHIALSKSVHVKENDCLNDANRSSTLCSAPKTDEVNKSMQDDILQEKEANIAVASTATIPTVTTNSLNNKLNKTGLDMSFTEIPAINKSIRNTDNSYSDKNKTVFLDENAACTSIIEPGSFNIVIESNKINDTDKNIDNMPLTEVHSKEITFRNDEMNNTSHKFNDVTLTQELPNNSTFDEKEKLMSDKRKAIVFDEDSADVSITKAVPLNVILALSKMNNTEDIDSSLLGQAILPDATINNVSVSAKRNTITSDSACPDVSINRSVPALIMEITENNDMLLIAKDTKETYVTHSTLTESENVKGNNVVVSDENRSLRLSSALKSNEVYESVQDSVLQHDEDNVAGSFVASLGASSFTLVDNSDATLGIEIKRASMALDKTRNDGKLDKGSVTDRTNVENALTNIEELRHLDLAPSTSDSLVPISENLVSSKKETMISDNARTEPKEIIAECNKSLYERSFGNSTLERRKTLASDDNADVSVNHGKTDCLENELDVKKLNKSLLLNEMLNQKSITVFEKRETFVYNNNVADVSIRNVTQSEHSENKTNASTFNKSIPSNEMSHRRSISTYKESNEITFDDKSAPILSNSKVQHSDKEPMESETYSVPLNKSIHSNKVLHEYESISKKNDTISNISIIQPLPSNVIITECNDYNTTNPNDMLPFTELLSSTKLIEPFSVNDKTTVSDEAVDKSLREMIPNLIPETTEAIGQEDNTANITSRVSEIQNPSPVKTNDDDHECDMDVDFNSSHITVDVEESFDIQTTETNYCPTNAIENNDHKSIIIEQNEHSMSYNINNTIEVVAPVLENTNARQNNDKIKEAEEKQTEGNIKHDEATDIVNKIVDIEPISPNSIMPTLENSMSVKGEMIVRDNEFDKASTTQAVASDIVSVQGNKSLYENSENVNLSQNKKRKSNELFTTEVDMMDAVKNKTTCNESPLKSVNETITKLTDLEPTSDLHTNESYFNQPNASFKKRKTMEYDNLDVSTAQLLRSQIRTEKETIENSVCDKGADNAPTQPSENVQPVPYTKTSFESSAILQNVPIVNTEKKSLIEVKMSENIDEDNVLGSDKSNVSIDKDIPQRDTDNLPPDENSVLGESKERSTEALKNATTKDQPQSDNDRTVSNVENDILILPNMNEEAQAKKPRENSKNTVDIVSDIEDTANFEDSPTHVLKDLVEEKETPADIIAKIKKMAFMESDVCRLEYVKDTEWSFLMLHSRLRLLVKLDGTEAQFEVECLHKDKVNTIADASNRFSVEAMRLLVGGRVRVCDVTSRVRACAALAGLAGKWTRAMLEAKLRVGFHLDGDHVVMDVANFSLRAVWEVRLRVSLVEGQGGALPHPRVEEASVGFCTSDAPLQLARVLRGVPQDWGHVPRALRRIFKYLKYKTYDDAFAFL